MPPEPKRPIEELLEASAKARRAEFGANPVMPNPMRARLHEEIVRLDRQEQAQPRRSWFAMFWPQISIATAVAAVLVTASVMWLGHKSESGYETVQLALNTTPASVAMQSDASAVFKSLDAPKDVATKTETAAPTFADGAGEATSERLATVDTIATSPAEAETRDEAKSNTLGKFAAAGNIAPAAPAGAIEEKAARERLASRVDQVAQQPTAGLAMESSDKLAGAASVRSAPQQMENRRAAALNVQQNFSQTTRGQTLRNNSNARQAAANILDSFQFEQDGRAIRVVDADGSTYTGKFEPVAVSAAPRMFKQKEAVAAPATAGAKRESGSSLANNEKFFRATGFNASLKKQVVFEGNYIALPAAQKTTSAARKSDAEQAPARIVGQARVPGEAPVEVDAATVSR